MLRALVLLLLVANLAYAAWWQGWLAPAGLTPRNDREPERLQRQIEPQSVQVRALQAAPSAPAASAPARASSAAAAAASVAVAAASASSAAAAAAPAEAASVAAIAAIAERPICLQVGPFDARQADAVRAAATGLPAGSWRLEEVETPARWMVYIGKLPSAEAVRTKRAELVTRGVTTDRPGAVLEPGLSLGRFSTPEAAERALTELTGKGVRTARVIQERPPGQGYLLRLPAADAALQQQLRALRDSLGGREARPCE